MNNIPSVHYAARKRAELRFRWYGRVALAFAIVCLVLLLGSVAVRGIPGFFRTEMMLDIAFNSAVLELQEGETMESVSSMRFNRLVQAALVREFPGVAEGEQRDLYKLVGTAAGLQLQKMAAGVPTGGIQSVRLPASQLVKDFLKNPASDTLSDTQRGALQHLKESEKLTQIFDYGFFTQGDSRQPESAGFLGAMMGSFFTMVVCLLAAFPIGVMSAVYLQEFSRKTKFSELIEVNVNNLAAVPSIVYGLLGLAMYINFMHLPRSAPLVGGLTLALMAFPVIIIATRSALASVPPSIRQAALALGASPLQVVWHHTLRLAMPGIMTGTILGMARAIGETAPLLMIGMVAFVADVPSGFTSAATTMPVQIYLWASSSEAGFVEKTASGILVLLAFLLCMNALAIYIRKKFEVRW